MDKLVNIGQSIQIKGDLIGNEDLTIEGKVDGKINLKDHNLTIGSNGKITAEIQAKTVMVIGEVVGNITADDKVEVAATGAMKGDIVAPRVVLADGARFKGSIDMDRKPGTSVPPKPGVPGSPGAPGGAA
jgi:cytoskeletal protein CcmA (bactofilin family)